MSTELEQEKELSATLADIAARLNKMPLSPEERQNFYGRLMVNIANAGGVSMDGKTFYDPAAQSSKEVETIAAALGTKATPHRNTVSVSPFAKPSLGASGTILYTDAKSGELMMLLVRRKKDSNQWMYPAGYMEVLPDGDKLLAPRVSGNARDTLEEKTAGGLAGEKAPAVPEGISGLQSGQTQLPSSEVMRKALDADFRKQMAQKGWNEAHRLAQDGDHIRDVLKNNGTPIPEAAGIDVTMRENYFRETREETGLDLKRFPDAHTQFVRMDASLSYSSGAQRNYTANPHFLTDLGALDAPPALGPQAGDTVEAAWVPVRNIARGADGQYSVQTPDGKTDPLNSYTVPVIEESLNAYLAAKISDASENRFGSPVNVASALASWQGKEQLRGADATLQASAGRILSEGVGADGKVSELTGPEGMQRVNDYIQAAATLTMKPQISVMNRIKAFIHETGFGL